MSEETGGTILNTSADPAVANTAATPDPNNLSPHQSFLEMLPEDLRGNKVFSNFQNIGDLAKSYANAATMVGLDKGAVLRLPSEDTPEAWGEVWNKIGRPETADGYDLKAYDESPYVDKEAMTKVREMAHKHGVRGAALQELVGMFVADTQAKVDAANAAKEKLVDDYQAKVKSEFGEAYDYKITQIRHSAQNIIGTIPEFAEFLKTYPEAAEHPGLIKFMSHYAGQTLEDTGSINGGSTSTGPLTPAEAQARLAAYQPGGEFYKIITEQGHPQRGHHLAQKSKLFQYAYPENKQEQKWK